MPLLYFCHEIKNVPHHDHFERRLIASRYFSVAMYFYTMMIEKNINVEKDMRQHFSNAHQALSALYMPLAFLVSGYFFIIHFYYDKQMPQYHFITRQCIALRYFNSIFHY